MSKKNINWTKKNEILLLKCVQAHGGHLPNGKKTTDTWEKIGNSFFDDNAYSEIKDSCFGTPEKDIRKLRDHFDKMKEDIEKLPAWSAFLGKGGNVSAMDSENEEAKIEYQFFNLYRQLQIELEDYQSESAKKAEDMKLKNVIEKEILDPTDEPVKKRKKNIDGSFTGSSTSTKGTVDKLDQQMFDFLKNNSKIDERESEVHLSKWFQENSTGLEETMDVFNLNPVVRNKVNDCVLMYGIDLVVSFYCSPGGNFEGDKFRACMQGMGIEMIVAQNFYRIFEYVRNNRINDFTTPSIN